MYNSIKDISQEVRMNKKKKSDLSVTERPSLTDLPAYFEENYMLDDHGPAIIGLREKKPEMKHPSE